MTTLLKQPNTTIILLEELVNDKELWREVMAALMTAEHETNRRVPRVPSGMKGMHQRAESLENIGNAIASRKGILYTHKRQARLRMPKPHGKGHVEFVLCSGIPQGPNVFRVNKKGPASQDLIALQQVFVLDFEGDTSAVRDEGAFIVLEKQFDDTDDPAIKNKRMIVHLAYPARLNGDGTLIMCEDSRIVGEYAATPTTRKPQTTKAKVDQPVKVVPPVAPKLK